MSDWFLDKWAMMCLRAAVVFRRLAFVVGIYTGGFLFSAFLYATATFMPNDDAAHMWSRLIRFWTFAWPGAVVLFLLYLFATSRPLRDAQ